METLVLGTVIFSMRQTDGLSPRDEGVCSEQFPEVEPRCGKKFLVQCLNTADPSQTSLLVIAAAAIACTKQGSGGKVLYRSGRGQQEDKLTRISVKHIHESNETHILKKTILFQDDS